MTTITHTHKLTRHQVCMLSRNRCDTSWCGTLVGVGAISQVRAGVMNFGVTQVMDTTQNNSQKRSFEVCAKCTPHEFTHPPFLAVRVCGPWRANTKKLCAARRYNKVPRGQTEITLQCALVAH